MYLWLTTERSHSKSTMAEWRASYLTCSLKSHNYMQNKKLTSSQDSTSWGGARPGAGRKPKAHGKSYAFQSTPEVDAFLTSYKGNKTEFINRAILAFAGQQTLSEHWTQFCRQRLISWSLWRNPNLLTDYHHHASALAVIKKFLITCPSSNLASWWTVKGTD